MDNTVCSSTTIIFMGERAGQDLVFEPSSEPERAAVCPPLLDKKMDHADHDNYCRKIKQKRAPQKHKCIVPRCLQVKKDQNHFHSVPREAKRRRAWETAIGRNLTVNMRVCSDHFLKSDYIPTCGDGSGRHLKRTAVPSQFRASRNNFETSGCGDYFESKEFDPIGGDVEGDLNYVKEEIIVSVKEVEFIESDARSLLNIIKSSNFGEQLWNDCEGMELGGAIEEALGPFSVFPEMQEELLETVQALSCGHEKSPNSLWCGEFLKKVLVLATMKLKSCDRSSALQYVTTTSSIFQHSS